MYAYTADSFRFIGDIGTPLTGEQVAEEVPAEVLAAIAVKEATWRRDSLLRASDWTQLGAGLAAEKVLEWAEYRTALLALTDSPDFPNVVWPVEPAR